MYSISQQCHLSQVISHRRIFLCGCLKQSRTGHTQYAVVVNINHVVAQREYSTWYDHLSHLSGNKHPSFVSNMPNLSIC
jgi:hypothetical protein